MSLAPHSDQFAVAEYPAVNKWFALLSIITPLDMPACAGMKPMSTDDDPAWIVALLPSGVVHEVSWNTEPFIGVTAYD